MERTKSLKILSNNIISDLFNIISCEKTKTDEMMLKLNKPNKCPSHNDKMDKTEDSGNVVHENANCENANREISTNFICIGNKYKKYNFSNYFINEYGQVKNRKRLLKPVVINGYVHYNLSDKNAKKQTLIRVHRLVASVFLENTNNYYYVTHKNNILQDNYFENLQWVQNPVILLLNADK
jgi:hypothetical protein